MVDSVNADRGEAYGSVDLVTKQLGRGVALVGVDEHTRDDLVAVEGRPVGEVCPAHASVAGGVVPASGAQGFFGLGFDLVWVGIEGRKLAFVGSPEQLALHQAPGRRGSGMDVGCVGVTHLEQWTVETNGVTILFQIWIKIKSEHDLKLNCRTK